MDHINSKFSVCYEIAHEPYQFVAAIFYRLSETKCVKGSICLYFMDHTLVLSSLSLFCIHYINSESVYIS